MRDRQIGKHTVICNSTLNRCRTPPPAAPPLSALSRGRGGYFYVSQSCNSTSIFATYLPHVHRNSPYPRSGGHCYAATFQLLASNTLSCMAVNLWTWVRSRLCGFPIFAAIEIGAAGIANIRLECYIMYF